MKIQNVKGGYDFLPKEQKIRNYINDTLKETFLEYGYNPIETPILCYLDILTDKYDENNDIVKEIYKLSDQGDRSLGLRYDLTVPFAKFIAINKNEITLPFKRFEINKVFRDGPIKVGRDREFTQCDVDVVGLGGQLIEAELISLYVSAFKKLDIPIDIKYNSRKLMTGLILESGVEEELVSGVTTLIDKKDKMSDMEFKEMLLEYGLSSSIIGKLFTYFNASLDYLKTLFMVTDNKLIKEGLEELSLLNYYLYSLGIDEDCVFDSSLARGQNYYTGNVFEVYDKEKRLTGSIGGGGRYDNMITDFIKDGNEYPAVGISFGLTSIFELLKNREDFKDKGIVDFYIIPIMGEPKKAIDIYEDLPAEYDEDSIIESNADIKSLEIANKLRDLGYYVELDMTGKKMKKSLDFANKSKIPYVIIIGDAEINNNVITVKDMFNKNSFNISLDNIDSIKEYVK